MPARIVLVHDDNDLLEEVAAAFAAIGHDVAAFESSMTALSALEDARTADVLITRLSFPPGNPNGLSLARMARVKRRDLKVLFAGCEQMRPYIDGVGELLPSPVNVADLVDTVRRLLAERDQPATEPAQPDGRDA